MSDITQSISESLAHFYSDAKELELTTDASHHGFGARLSIRKKIMAFASIALSKTKQNYAQIEKELHAIVFGCKKFQQYIYGRDKTVDTDYKPLEVVLSKPIATAPPRLKRMLARIIGEMD